MTREVREEEVVEIEMMIGEEVQVQEKDLQKEAGIQDHLHLLGNHLVEGRDIRILQFLKEVVLALVL